MHVEPEIVVVGAPRHASAPPAEAAAIVAAVTRFLRDTAPPPGRDAQPDLGRWVRTARLEAVDRAPITAAEWR